MKKRFFRPFVGKHYNEGIRGKKILVLAGKAQPKNIREDKLNELL